MSLYLTYLSALILDSLTLAELTARDRSMILNLLLCQHFFATGIQGQLLSAFDEGSSRPVVLPLLLGRSGELGRLLVQAPLTRASSFLDLLSRTFWEVNKASMSQLRRPPRTRLRKRGRETKGSWPPTGRIRNLGTWPPAGRAKASMKQMPAFNPVFTWSSHRRVKTKQQAWKVDVEKVN